MEDTPLQEWSCVHSSGANGYRLTPERVYLHAGTRIGARKSDLLPRSGDRREWLESNEIPAPLRDLRPSDVENLLCIYEERLPRLTDALDRNALH